MGHKAGHRKRQVSLWHEGFADCTHERVPSCFQLISEFELSRRPRRADLLLLRREGEPPNDHDGRILRGLWPRLAKHTLLEFKSPSRGYAAGDLSNLQSYGGQYYARYLRELESIKDLTLVLVTPEPTEDMGYELAHAGWRMRELKNGYAEIKGMGYATFVAFTNRVAEAEQDDFLRIFSHNEVQTDEAKHWLADYIIMKETGHALRDREGYDPMVQKLLRSLAPEVRLAGLSPEDMILALPDEALRALSKDYVRTLPRRVQTAIKKRLGK